MAVVGEVALGGLVTVLIEAIIIAKKKESSFKKTLENLESTLQSVGPIMEQLIKSERVPSDLSTRFAHQLRKAKILVEMYYDTRACEFLERRKVKKLIQQTDATLQRLLAQDFQAKQLAYLTDNRDFQAKQLAYLTDIAKILAKLNKKTDRAIALWQGNKANGFEPPEPDIEEALSGPENGSSSDESLKKVQILHSTDNTQKETVVIGKVIGDAFQQFHDSVVAAVVKSSELKFQLELLQTTVRTLTRKFEKIGDLLLQLEEKFPNEILKLQQLLEKAKQLVSECSEVSRLNLYKKIKYKKRLAELDLSLKEMLVVDSPAVKLNYTAQVLVKVVEMNKKLAVMFD